MSKKSKALAASAAMMATQAQAAVDVSGFTAGGGSAPYGLFIMALVLAAIGVGYMVRTPS